MSEILAFCWPLFAGGMAPAVPAVGGTFILLTGSGGLKEMYITWRVLPASPAKDNFLLERNLLWSKRKSFVEYIMTACWTI